MIKLINRYFFKYFKLKLIQTDKPDLPVDLEPDFLEVYKKCKPFTMTSIERMNGAFNAIQYIHDKGIEGSIVECGVWKGGTMMIMAEKLMSLHSKSRELFLYDTFEGMIEPTEKDIDFSGKNSLARWKKSQKSEINEWCYAPIEEVTKNLEMTKYPQNKIHYVKGKVQDTIPGTLPEKIALLRLDTDWYDSTKHELTYLFPLLQPGGILIIDDYGFWKGQKEAVDEYFKEKNQTIFLNRLDYSGRLIIKGE